MDNVDLKLSTRLEFLRMMSRCDLFRRWRDPPLRVTARLSREGTWSLRWRQGPELKCVREGAPKIADAPHPSTPFSSRDRKLNHHHRRTASPHRARLDTATADLHPRPEWSVRCSTNRQPLCGPSRRWPRSLPLPEAADIARRWCRVFQDRDRRCPDSAPIWSIIVNCSFGFLPSSSRTA